MAAPEKKAGAIVLCIVAFCAWWILASDYGDGAAAGTYRFRQGGVDSTLVLKGDHTFNQRLTQSGKSLRETGSWRRVGEGGISFSREFLELPGEEVEPDGTTFADMHKSLGLFVSLELRRHHVLWYGRRNSSAEKAPVGTYVGDEPGVSAMLTLNENHSFDQDIAESGSAHHAKGSWSAGAHGEIRFSREFLKVSGQPLSEYESAIAYDPQGSNLQITIANVSGVAPPIFRKRVFPW